MRQNKVIIFGCGMVGAKVKEKLEEEGMKVVAFTDNDEIKWKTLFEEIEVIEPQKIKDLEFDYIAIGVYKAVEVIKNQLLQMGIEEHRIKIPIEPSSKIFVNTQRYTKEELLELPAQEYYSISTKEYQKHKVNILDEIFLKKLEKLKEILYRYNIPRKKVCIVSGAVLQAYGLRKSKKFDDIDIIMTDDLRQLYGRGLVIVSNFIEMHPQNKYKVIDDKIIHDINNHFIFGDLKFMNLKLLYESKKNLMNSEDEIKLIEEFWKRTMN